jgi:16S rRNA (cytosine967-C5)-methyltransferase
MPAQKSSSFTVSPSRREAFAVLLEMERGQSHSDDLLRGSRVSALSAQDRNLCTTLVMGSLRWQLSIDAAIRPLLNKPNASLDPEIRIALRLGAFQLQYLDRVPAHAAIGESVALAKQAGHKFASGMVNAVLRKLAAQPKPQPPSQPAISITELASLTAHPAWLVERWADNYGLEAACAICQHGQQQPELSIRVDDPAVESELAAEEIHLEPGAILTAARRVSSGDVSATQVFSTGRVRIQEEGSQLIAELAGKAMRILDCCAAPGGKTLILAERNPEAQITACEISPARLEALRTRIAASEYAARINLLLADVKQLPVAGAYDFVLADVPCSGTGTLGRNPEIRHRLQSADLARHHERQCAILRGALRASTHRVVYSTCSLEPEENTAVVAEVLAEAQDWEQKSVSNTLSELREKGRLTLAGAENLQKAIAPDGSLTLLPGSLGPDIETDGFFIAIFEKRT